MKKNKLKKKALVLLAAIAVMLLLPQHLSAQDGGLFGLGSKKSGSTENYGLMGRDSTYEGSINSQDFLTQCKKNDEQIINANEGEKTHITLSVSQGSSSKHNLDPPHVTFENGDRIYVASNGVSVGYILITGVGLSLAHAVFFTSKIKKQLNIKLLFVFLHR